MLRPVNGRVFVKRDPEEDELNGIAVGERAKVKSLMATVVAADSDFVSVGDRVHLPHQAAKLQDCDIDGQELTCVRAGDLFAVEIDGVLRPINRYIKIRKCEEDHVRDASGRIALYMTDNFIEQTNWVEVVDFAEDCHLFPHQCVGWFCVAPEADDRMQRAGRTKDYFLHEELIPFITDGE